MNTDKQVRIEIKEDSGNVLVVMHPGGWRAELALTDDPSPNLNIYVGREGGDHLFQEIYYHDQDDEYLIYFVGPEEDD